MKAIRPGNDVFFRGPAAHEVPRPDCQAGKSFIDEIRVRDSAAGAARLRSWPSVLKDPQRNAVMIG